MDILIQRRDMIQEYFSLVITKEGILTSIPLLLKNYTPSYGKLPSFIRRLGQNVPPSLRSFHPLSSFWLDLVS